MSQLVSLILPVYNVENYIDPCLESVTNQTYKDLEILLINDGSTDGSLQKCLEWKEKDPRVKVIDKENEGVSASRNLGVQVSTGTVIGFIDPDDWVDETYVEKLLNALETEGADYAECDIWRYDNRTGKKIYRSCGSRMDIPYTLEEHMKYGPTATYKALSRKSLWTRYGIHMPPCSFESPAIYSLVLALSGKTAYVPEALYYYRRFRENSLIENGYANRDGSANNTLAIEAMQFLISEFRRCGIYDQYSHVLEGVVRYRLNDILAMQFHRRSKEDFRELVHNYRVFLEEWFPNSHNESYMLFGGSNLNRILQHMDILQDPYCRFNFSSLISVCGKKDPTIQIAHRNKYRAIMLQRESEQVFWDILEEVKPAYLFMDFIEERFDILEKDGCYLTKSDAYDGADSSFREKRTILRNSPECDALWKDNFDLFTQRVRQISPTTHMILLENYLAEEVGDPEHREPYPEIREILALNEVLKGYYGHVRQNYPEIPVIETADSPLYFTDRKYEYGAIPSHLNEIVNQEIAKKVYRLLDEGNFEEYDKLRTAVRQKGNPAYVQSQRHHPRLQRREISSGVSGQRSEPDPERS